MADFTRYVANKLSGEWSASNVSGVLTDTIIDVSRRPGQPAVRDYFGLALRLCLELAGPCLAPAPYEWASPTQPCSCRHQAIRRPPPLPSAARARPAASASPMCPALPWPLAAAVPGGRGEVGGSGPACALPAAAGTPLHAAAGAGWRAAALAGPPGRRRRLRQVSACQQFSVQRSTAAGAAHARHY